MFRYDLTEEHENIEKVKAAAARISDLLGYRHDQGE
jgi:hypothetical protein